MANSSIWIQAHALLLKNLTFQKRNIGSNIRLISFPLVVCLLIVVIQFFVDHQLDKPELKCGCKCVDGERGDSCNKVCGIQYSDFGQLSRCSITNPPEWPPLLQIPPPPFRAVTTNTMPFTDLPSDSCRATLSCPITILLTGNNQSLAKSLIGSAFPKSFSSPFKDVMGNLASNVLGTLSDPAQDNLLDPAFVGDPYPISAVLSQRKTPPPIAVPIRAFPSVLELQKEISYVQALPLWRNSSSVVNDELYKGYFDGNPDGKANEIAAGYDFSNTNEKIFNITVWYNATYSNDKGNNAISLVRVPRSVNLASNSYLRFLKGAATKMLFEFTKEMPRAESQVKLDFSSLLGPVFFTWIILQLFPVILKSLVYEKQQKLRIMMKMHGLGDRPYWMISYAYFLLISSVYMLFFVVFGAITGLKFFTLNDYGIQFVFYFIYINLQIAVAFLAATMFSDVKAAEVTGYGFVFGSGLLGAYLFSFFIQDRSFPRAGVIFMELYPGFSMYRGLYEFSQYAMMGNTMDSEGMRWADLKDSENGMAEVLIIMSIEWFVVLALAYYIDHLISTGRSPLYFLQSSQKPLRRSPRPSFQREGSNVYVQMEKPDVSQERGKVDQMLLESSMNHAIICDNLKKVFPGIDGNPDKLAVKGLSLALPQGECFGMLGTSGAGKTTVINMLIGLTKPTSGAAYVEGLDICSQMNDIYTCMGVCPQYDLIWETLTGREHLLFYGRLKNLKGSSLNRAVDESLDSVGLLQGGVGDKPAGAYSGGMKRRLSVAISLIGNPKVVYLDEPSTGLDPASRFTLWEAVKNAKQGRAIILTTHSMEEAEALCDRLGIFVDGSLQCIGSSKELKARYGGGYVFTMTTSSEHDEEVEKLVRNLCPSANKTYHIAGTQKFEMPKSEVKISKVFELVEAAKRHFTVYAWGLSDNTMEDVFIKVAMEPKTPKYQPHH